MQTNSKECKGMERQKTQEKESTISKFLPSSVVAQETQRNAKECEGTKGRNAQGKKEESTFSKPLPLGTAQLPPDCTDGRTNSIP